MVAPVYTAEMAPTSSRGFLTSFPEVFINFDDPDPTISRESDPNSSLDPTPNDDDDDDDDAWSFGGMFKTLAMQSETVIEIYRRDLEEFGSGLRKETELFRETASRAVKDLPASIDGVLKSTVNIISKESLGFPPDGESGPNRSPGSGRYSRFEAQVSAIRNDLNTFCVEPGDVEDYGKWKLGFELENYSDEIERLIGGNGILEGVYKRVVAPNGGVDGETFWCRYFYRVEKLKQKESVRANLVRRAISVDDELSSWDFDDDDDGGDQSVKGGDGNDGNDGNSKPNASDGEKNKNNVVISKEENVQTVGEDEKKVKSEDRNDEKVMVESDGKSKAVVEEEDLNWDEIENTGSGGGERIAAIDHRKPLNDDDEDLNWGIEDDEAVKA